MKTRCSHQPFSTDFRSMRSALLVSFIVLVIAPSVAFSTGGVGHPNIARGFNQYGSSTYGSIDSVNLFNGGLGLSIPIGQSFTVSEQLSYQIGIQYNSSVWNVAEDEDVCSAFPGGNWDFYAEPSPTDNAGLGWQSKFGMVLEPTFATAPGMDL